MCVVRVKFFCCKVTLSPFFHNILFGMKSLFWLMFKELEIFALPSLRMRYQCALFGIMPHRTFVFQHIYLFNHWFFFSYGFMGIYFKLQVIIQYYFILLLIIQSWGLEALSFGCVHSTYLHHCVLYCESTSLHSGSFCMFLALT